MGTSLWFIVILFSYLLLIINISDSVVNLCPQCNIQVHSLDIFRAHKVEPIESKVRIVMFICDVAVGK